MEQDVDFARRLAASVYVMEKGSIVLAGKIQELSEADGHGYLGF